MKVALICADDDSWALGMRSISAVLKKAGHRTRMIFTSSASSARNGDELESIGDLAEHSELIGVSSMSRSSGKAKAIISALKPLQKPIVWGGMHPTLYPEDCVAHPDLICRGEGEEFMLELVDRLASGGDFRDLRNGGYKENGRIILNDIRPLIANLDDLPMYDFSFDDEFRLNSQREFQTHPATSPSSSILFSGSRGCVCHCHYCSNSQLKLLYEGKGRYVRKMSINRFVESAQACREKFPHAKYFHFTDEDFFARPLDDFRQFVEIYPAKVGLPFECMASPQQITEEKMALLVKSGMWRIDVGVESGSDRVKKEVYNRPISNEIVLRSASIIRRYPQILAFYFVIIGNPYEGRKDLQGTIGLLKSLPPPFFLQAYNLVFIPGTILFNRACKDGIIDGMEDSGYDIDFLAGLDYRNHNWKRNNLYLNGLIFLMAGKSTPRRMGFLPRALFPVLTHPRVIDFNDRHQAMIKASIDIARGGVTVRRKGAKLIIKVLKDPRSIYKLRAIRRKIMAATSNREISGNPF